MFKLKFLVFLSLQLRIEKGQGELIYFEDFYSQSFIPDALQIAYYVENNVSVYYNVTALIPFPGKILFNIFVRRLSGEPGVRSRSVLKYKNMDFCKTLDVLKNFTNNAYEMESWLQPTFIVSCPLMRGFYYVINGTINEKLVPLAITPGLYWVHFEVLQIFEEVTKLMNINAKCKMK